MNLRSGRATGSSLNMANNGENVDNQNMQDRGDIVVEQGVDMAQFMQQIRDLVMNQTAQLSYQMSETNNKISETNNNISETKNDLMQMLTREISQTNSSTRSSIAETKEILGKKLDENVEMIKREFMKENTNLREQIEKTNENLNKKIDNVTGTIEKQILNKVDKELDKMTGKIMEIDEQYSKSLDVMNNKLELENENLKSQIGKISKEKNSAVCMWQGTSNGE